jgi:cytochrome c oxidase assembly protein subunit 11
MNTLRANQLVMKKLLVVALGMFGFGFALVPLYEKICEVTGINNVIRADTLAGNTQVDTARYVTVELDANSRLPWTFRPLQKRLNVHPGELAQVEYEITNETDRPVKGQAVPSYAPQVAGRYLKKFECFCFTEKVLQPGETRRLPVVFVVGNELPESVHTITLSYTFFLVEGAG